MAVGKLTRMDDEALARHVHALRIRPGLAAYSFQAPGAGHAALELLVVLAALESLSEQDREALMLTVWDGLSYRQSAEVVGCSTTEVAAALMTELGITDSEVKDVADRKRAARGGFTKRIWLDHVEIGRTAKA